MRVLRTLIVPGTAALLAGTVTLSGATAITAGGHARANPAVPSARFLAQARTALTGYLRRGHPQALLVHPGTPAAAAGTSSASTFNWSGYVDLSSATSGTFTKVSGSWTAPSVTCTAEDQITSDWVGLDGYGTSKVPNTTVEQLGTIGWCYQGSPIYFTWYEIYPAGTAEVGMTLRPGDKISASLTRSGANYTLKLTDATHPANSFTKTATCATKTCRDTSAEWISERPSFSIGTVPQAHYNAFKITNGAETANGKSGTIGSFTPNYALTMVDATGAYPLGSVSALTSGSSFSTSWKNSY